MSAIHSTDVLAARFRSFVRDPSHPCALAKSVVAQDAVEFASYASLGGPESAAAMCRDVYASMDKQRHGLWSFVAMFPDEEIADEHVFESRLWMHLQLMHDYDAVRHGWDAAVSADPEDASFSFSIGGCAWYIIGLHPQASRHSRRLENVALVLNPHAQFENLRERGRYASVRDQIRQRDMNLQGSINPMLRDHGEASEARQYSGRATSEAWKCPFHPVSTRAG